MDPSNRFAKLKLQEDELPIVSSFYNFMAASFPNIDEHLGLKPKKPFCHLGKSANSKTMRGEKRKFEVCPDASKKSKVCSFAGNSSQQTSENVNNIKQTVGIIKKEPKCLVDYDRGREFEDTNISGVTLEEEPYISSSGTSTILCATIKSEPLDDSCVDVNMNDCPALEYDVKKELKMEPVEEDYDVSELMTMTKNVITKYFDRELHTSEVYSTFLDLCRCKNVFGLKEEPTPTIVEWKFNLFHFLRCILSTYNSIDMAIIENFTLTQCYEFFIGFHQPKQ